MNRDARVQQWEKHLAKIIEQTNKNISSLPMGSPHEMNEHNGTFQSSQNIDNIEDHKYYPQNGYHHLQAQHVIRGNSMGFVNRSVPKQVEEDLSARVGINAKRTAEKIVNEKLHSTHTRIDRLHDKVGEISEDGVKIHKEYGLLARQLATQDRLTKRLKQEYEHQKNLVTKLGEALANDVGWKENVGMDIKMIKDQMRQDSATCVTTADMKDALEAITTKTMLAMERSAMSAKLAFESDVAHLKQEMSYLKQDNEKLKNELIVTRDASKALTAKLEKSHITTVIANAVESQIQSVEQKVTNTIKSFIEHDLVLIEEKINASVVDKMKTALGREIVQGGGDFHRVISGMIVKVISDDNDILDALSSMHKSRYECDEPKDKESDERRALQSRIDTLEKRLNVLVTNTGSINKKGANSSSLMIDDIQNVMSPVETSLNAQLTSLETTLKEYCDNKIESCSSTAANAFEQIQIMTPKLMESLELEKKLNTDVENLEGKMKEELGNLKHNIEADVLENINRIDIRTEKNEASLTRNMEHLQNDLNNVKNQLNELERKDFTNLHVDMNALKNSVEILKNSKNYSVEDLASCLGKVTSLENKLRQEMGTLRSEFIDLQGNVYDQNAASSERIDIMIQQVQNDIERLRIYRLTDDSKGKPPPEIITIQTTRDAEDNKESKKIYTYIETLQKRLQDLNFLPNRVESLEEKVSSQGVEFRELSGILDVLQTSFTDHMTAERTKRSCPEQTIDNVTEPEILVAENASLNESIDKGGINSIDSNGCLENVERSSEVKDNSEDDLDVKDNDEDTQKNENDLENISIADSAFSSSKTYRKSIHDINAENHSDLVIGTVKGDSCQNEFNAQEEFQMSDSIEGCIFDVDEIQSVTSPLEEESKDDLTSDIRANNSDDIYESDFEELETK